MKIRLTLSYQGTHFYGWQRQKNVRTVQGELEKALFRLFRRPVPLTGSGRTDAGVHALGQTAHFEIPDSLRKPLNILKALNHLTPQDISLYGAFRAPEEFHARFSAKKKTYSFFVFTAPFPPALGRDFVYWRPGELNLKKLQKTAEVLVGTKDFKSLQSSGASDRDKTIKTVYSAKWTAPAPFLYRFDMTGSGFLKQMVRNAVGAQLSLLREKSPEEILREILKTCDRSQAPAPAPGRGLYLLRVFYPPELNKKCRALFEVSV